MEHRTRGQEEAEPSPAGALVALRESDFPLPGPSLLPASVFACFACRRRRCSFGISVVALPLPVDFKSVFCPQMIRLLSSFGLLLGFVLNSLNERQIFQTFPGRTPQNFEREGSAALARPPFVLVGCFHWSPNLRRQVPCSYGKKKAPACHARPESRVKPRQHQSQQQLGVRASGFLAFCLR